MSVQKRNAVFASIPQGCKKHLFVVMTDPYGVPLLIILVNLCTYKAGKSYVDGTTILDVGAHPFITRTSYVDYEYARKIKVEVMERRVLEGYAEWREDVSEDVFNSILQGLLTSPRTPGEIKKIVRRLNI